MCVFDSIIYYLLAKASNSFSNLPNLSGNHRAVVPPDPIPNSEVKHSIADGSVGFPHVRGGHFQAPILLIKSSIKPVANATGFFTSAI